MTTRVRDATSVGAELGVVVAFGRIVPPEVLDELPIVNLHLSLLPRWRGAAPIERAILAGDTTTGVSLMRLDEGLDTGGVYTNISTPIDPVEDAESLGRRLVDLGTKVLVERLSKGTVDGLGAPSPQVGEATYAEKLTAIDRTLDFSRSAEECLRVVRIGRARTTFRGEPLLVHRAELVEDPKSGTLPGELDGDVVGTARGAFRLLEVQPPGRRSLGFAQFAHGARITHGELLGGPISNSDAQR